MKSAVRMTSPAKSHPPPPVPASRDKLASERYNYSSAIKIFHHNDCGTALLTSPSLLPMPPGAAIPGVVCKAAREMLNVSQAWLWKKARVSRKTINDFENGFIEPKIALNNRLRRALEEAGANFVCGEAATGVVVYSVKVPPSKPPQVPRDEEN